MNVFALTQVSTSEIINELRFRLGTGFAPNGMSLMVTIGEINLLMNSCEAWIMEQYAEQCGYYPEVCDV